MSENPICETLGEEYQKKVREALGEALEVLDCIGKSGEEVVSDEDESELDEEEEGDEEDEDDMEEGESEDEEGDDAGEDGKEKAGVAPAGEEETEEASTD